MASSPEAATPPPKEAPPQGEEEGSPSPYKSPSPIEKPEGNAEGSAASPPQQPQGEQPSPSTTATEQEDKKNRNATDGDGGSPTKPDSTTTTSAGDDGTQKQDEGNKGKGEQVEQVKDTVLTALGFGAKEDDKKLVTTTKDNQPDDYEIALECVLSNNIEGLYTVFRWDPFEEIEEGEGASNNTANENTNGGGTLVVALPSEEGAEKKKRKGYPTKDDNQSHQALLMKTEYDHDDMDGSLVFFAAYHNRKRILEYFSHFEIFKETLCSRAMFRMLSFQRYAMVHYLIDLYPQVLQSCASDGNNLLHTLCSRRKPAVDFLKELLSNPRFKNHIDLNAKNTAGLTALHLLATKTKGVEGKDCAKLLIKAGCYEEERSTKEGQTACKMATNPYVRDILGFVGAPKGRAIPAIDEQSKSVIDGCKDSSQFPTLKEIEVEPSTLEDPSRHSPERGDKDGAGGDPKGKPAKKLNAEAREAMVRRLFDQSIEKKNKWMEKSFQELEEKDKSHSKILSAEEVEAAVSRVYREEIDRRESKMEEVRGKYMPEKEPKTIPSNEVEDSVNRLCKTSMEKKAQEHQKLMAQYAPPHAKKSITKDQVAACAQRLHDESSEHTKQEWGKLYNTYCVREPGRFDGARKLTKEEVAAMGDRLSSKK